MKQEKQSIGKSDSGRKASEGGHSKKDKDRILVLSDEEQNSSPKLKESKAEEQPLVKRSNNFVSGKVDSSKADIDRGLQDGSEAN